MWADKLPDVPRTSRFKLRHGPGRPTTEERGDKLEAFQAKYMLLKKKRVPDYP